MRINLMLTLNYSPILTPINGSIFAHKLVLIHPQIMKYSFLFFSMLIGHLISAQTEYDPVDKSLKGNVKFIKETAYNLAWKNNKIRKTNKTRSNYDDILWYYNEQGVLTKEITLNFNNSPISIIEYSTDNKNITTTRTTHFNNLSIHYITLRKRDESNNLLEDIRLSSTGDIIEKEENTFDKNGRIIEKLVTEDNIPASKVKYFYNEKGLLVKKEMYDLSETYKIKPIEVLKYKYNSEARVSEKTATYEFSQDNMKWTYRYDSRGNKISESKFDWKQKFVQRVTYNYNKDNLLVLYGHTFANNSEDNVKTIYKYSYLNQIVEEINFRHEKVEIKQYSYNEKGEKTSTKIFENGILIKEILNYDEGYHTETISFNIKGEVSSKKTIKLNSQGLIAIDEVKSLRGELISRFEYEYDSSNLKIQSRYFETKSDTIYSKTTNYNYNNKELISESWFDSEGKSGFVKNEFGFNFWNTVLFDWYDFILGVDTTKYVSYTLTANGQTTKSTYHKSDRRLFSFQTYKFDKKGFLKQEQHFNSIAQLIRTFKYTNDSKGNWTKMVTYIGGKQIPNRIVEREIEYYD